MFERDLSLHTKGAAHTEACTVLCCALLPERDFVIDNLLVRIHLIIETNLVYRPCAMEIWMLFSR